MRRVLSLSAVILLLWVGLALAATNVYYSVCPFGTGDIKTGSPTISISSGIAVLSVAQTGNIGQGCRITYNTSSFCFISGVVDSTHFNVVTAIGGTPGDVSGQTVNSIAHEYASLTDAMAGYTDAGHINNASIVSADVIVHLAHYYDHADYTVDGSNREYLDSTTDGTRYLHIYAPRGLSYNESILNNRHDGKWDANKSLFDQSSYSYTLSFRTNKVLLDGLQIRNTLTGGYPLADGTTSNADRIIQNCILRGPNGYLEQQGSSSGTHFINCIVYSDSLVADSEGIYLNSGTGIINLLNCTIYNYEDGIENDSGTINVTNCAVFSCTDDFDGTTTIDHCASDDGDGTNAVNISPGATEATEWAKAFTDYANGDFSVKDASSVLYNAGADLSASMDSVDIIGTSRPQSTSWDIGAFEYVAKWNGITPAKWNGVDWSNLKWNGM